MDKDEYGNPVNKSYIPGVPDEVSQEVYDHDKADYEEAGRWQSVKAHYDERLEKYKGKEAPKEDKYAPKYSPTPIQPTQPQTIDDI